MFLSCHHESVRSRNTSGLSLVEVVILVSVISVLAAMGMSRLGTGTRDAANEVKMEQDLRILNSAVSAYVASGGDLSGVSSPSDVLVRLKTRASEEQRRRLPGLGGSFLSGEVEFEYQSDEEAKSGAPRLAWSSERNRFDLIREGGDGILNVVMNRSGVVSSEEAEETRSTSMQFAAKSSWIWDYQDAAVATPVGASSIPTGEKPSSVPAATAASSPPMVRNPLQPPAFSIPGGRFPEYDFPISLELTNPNPTGVGRVYYSVNYRAWQPCQPGEVVSVSPETSIKAQVVPVDGALWDPSPVVEELYHSYALKLLPPEIEFDQPFFVASKTTVVNTITVILKNPNEPGTSSILYRIVPVPGGSGPTTSFTAYSGPFAVNATDYPGGFGVKAYASSAKVGYEDSRMNTRFATELKGVFGGHLDLDTSTTLAAIASGDTDAHTHDITGKYGVHSLDFFAIPEAKQIELPEAIKDPAQRFKLTMVNADLSPGMSLVIDYEINGVNRVVDTTVGRYDDTPVEDLTVFTLGGVSGTARLKRVQLVMSQDVIHEAGVIPTTTQDVVSNILGKGNEWRNGSLTVQAVAVSADGKDGFSTDAALSNGDHGAARSGLLWEAALFWHWDGESYDDERNQYVPGQFKSVQDHIQN